MSTLPSTNSEMEEVLEDLPVQTRIFDRIRKIPAAGEFRIVLDWNHDPDNAQI